MHAVFTNAFNFFPECESLAIWYWVKCRHEVLNHSGRCLKKVLGPHLWLVKFTVKSSFSSKENVEKITSSQSQANSSSAHFGADCFYIPHWFVGDSLQCEVVWQFLYIHGKSLVSSWCWDKLCVWNAFSRLPWLAKQNNRLTWFYCTWFSLLPWKSVKSTGPWRIWSLLCQLKWVLCYSNTTTFSFSDWSSNY